MKGEFTAELSVFGEGKRLRNVICQVTRTDGVCLLSKNAATELGVLRVGRPDYACYVYANTAIVDKSEADIFSSM